MIFFFNMRGVLKYIEIWGSLLIFDHKYIAYYDIFPNIYKVGPTKHVKYLSELKTRTASC